MSRMVPRFTIHLNGVEAQLEPEGCRLDPGTRVFHLGLKAHRQVVEHFLAHGHDGDPFTLDWDRYRLEECTLDGPEGTVKALRIVPFSAGPRPGPGA